MTVRYTRRAAKEMEDLPLEDQKRVLEAMDLAEELRQSLKEVEADGDTLVPCNSEFISGYRKQKVPYRQLLLFTVQGAISSLGGKVTVTGY